MGSAQLVGELLRFLLLGGGVVVGRGGGAVCLGRVLMRLAVTVSGEHGGLLVRGSGTPVRRTGLAVPLGRGVMRPFGSR